MLVSIKLIFYKYSIKNNNFKDHIKFFALELLICWVGPGTKNYDFNDLHSSVILQQFQ